jgi:hypothetical protein
LSLFQGKLGVAFATVPSLILPPGNVTTQLRGLNKGFVWMSNNGNPDESRSSRHERSLYFRPVAVNTVEPSSSEILYARSDWGLPCGLMSRVVLSVAICSRRKATCRSGAFKA